MYAGNGNSVTNNNNNAINNGGGVSNFCPATSWSSELTNSCYLCVVGQATTLPGIVPGEPPKQNVTILPAPIDKDKPKPDHNTTHPTDPVGPTNNQTTGGGGNNNNNQGGQIDNSK